jgi:hypothetical protein
MIWELSARYWVRTDPAWPFQRDRFNYLYTYMHVYVYKTVKVYYNLIAKAAHTKSYVRAKFALKSESETSHSPI